MGEEVRGVDRLKEIIQLAFKLGWIVNTPLTSASYPLMQLSEVEKCMLAMCDDCELVRMRDWVQQSQSPEQPSEESE